MKIIKNITFSILIVALFFGSLEFIQRIRYSYKQGNTTYLLYGFNRRFNAHSEKNDSHIRWIDTFRDIPTSGLKCLPGVYNREYRGRRFPVKINKLGFRGEEVALKKEADVLRIAMLGGSSVAGHETSDDETVTKILQDLINADKAYLSGIQKKRAEVINAGIGGATSDIVLRILREDIVVLNPDIVIVYSAFNDYRKAGIYDFAQVGQVGAYLRLKAEKLWEWLYSHSLLFASVYEKIYLYREKKISLDRSEKVFNHYEDNLEHIIEICDQNKIRLILVKQPLYIENVNASLENKKVASGIETRIKNGKNISYDEAYYWMQSRELQILDKLSTAYDIELIDPIDKMYGNKELFYDIVHRSEEGNRVLADIIFKRMTEKYR